MQTGELRNRKRLIPLQDQPFRLLALLLERTGQVVSRDEVRERLWGADTFVAVDDGLNQAVKKLREALGDSADRPTYVETLARRGYRFLAPVKPAAGHLRPNSGTAVLTSNSWPAPARMVGRQAQLAKLRSALDAAAAAQGAFLCVTGEPGIGKTMLVNEFLSTAAAEGAFRVGAGRCSERLFDTEAYLPVLEALQSMMESDSHHTIRAIMASHAPAWYLQLAPLEAAALPEFAVGNAVTPERLKREFYAFLRQVSLVHPVVLFLDDLHWADDATVDLLAYIAPRCAGLKVLLLATFRPSDLLLKDHPFHEIKLELQTRRAYREIDVPLLSEADVARYLYEEFDGGELPASIPAWFHSRTEGSPLFLVDLVRDLRQGSLLRFENGEVQLAGAVLEGLSTIPESVRAMVERKLGRLDANDRKLLQAASTQGISFDAAIAAEVLQVTSSQTEESLETLESRHRLVRFEKIATLPDGAISVRYRFVHALYQQALYHSLAAPRLAAFCAGTAEALLARHVENRNTIASELAYLFEAAFDWKRAAAHFLLASEEASRLSSQEKAAALARRAIRNAERYPDSSPIILRAAFQLARARQAVSEFGESIAAFEVAEYHAKQIGDVHSEVEAVCGSGVCLFHLRRLAQVAEHGRRGLATATAAGWGPGIAYAKVILALERFFIGDLDSMRDLLDGASSVLQAAAPGLEHAAEIAVSYRGFLHSLQSEYAAADPLFERSLERARSLVLSFDVIRILWMRGMELGNRGLFDRALSTLEEALRMAETSGDAYWLPRIPNTIGWIYGEMFDRETCLRLNTEGVKIAQEKAFPEGEANARINLALEYIVAGELEAAGEHIQKSELILNEENEKVWLRWRFNIRLRGAQASYWLARGDTARAAELARTSVSLARTAGARKHVASGYKLLGDIAIREERIGDAAREYGQALTVLDRYPCPIVEWRVLHALANVTPTNGDLIRAQAKGVLDKLASNIVDARTRRQFQSLTVSAEF